MLQCNKTAKEYAAAVCVSSNKGKASSVIFMWTPDTLGSNHVNMQEPTKKRYAWTGKVTQRSSLLKHTFW